MVGAAVKVHFTVNSEQHSIPGIQCNNTDDELLDICKKRRLITHLRQFLIKIVSSQVLLLELLCVNVVIYCLA